MSLRPQNIQAIRTIVRERMVQSGVDNYSFVDGHLQIGSTRYAVDACGCGEPECDGLRLRRVPHAHGPQAH
jgi:hypothetical protein